MLGLKLNHVSKEGPGVVTIIYQIHQVNTMAANTQLGGSHSSLALEATGAIEKNTKNFKLPEIDLRFDDIIIMNKTRHSRLICRAFV